MGRYVCGWARRAAAAAAAAALEAAAEGVRVPAGPNSWVFDAAGACQPSRLAQPNGIEGWSAPTQRLRTFFWTDSTGVLEVGVRASVKAGASRVRCSLDGTSREFPLTNAVPADIEVGVFTVARPGYQALAWEGVAKSGATFAELAHVTLSGPAASGAVRFIADDVHFGRRGPSVHLRYLLPQGARDICWLYNEACVPAGMDALGTYCMANGFGEGYCGMQVNSASERRILFSVWSPFRTDNPKEVPEADRVVLLAAGKGVRAQAFGGEGAGGQSYLVYPWRAGVAYRFLLHGAPDGAGATVYTAYFFAPEEGAWRLLASFRRPKTDTWLRGWHSFLENFSPDAGALTREARFGNQWARDKVGNWHAPTQAVFTADATARKGARMDYTGGVAEDGRFFLRNGGFFNERREPDTALVRPSSGQPAPAIDFSALPRE